MQAMFFGPFEFLFVLLLGGGLGVPVGVPPGPEDPLLGNVAPETCLFYTSWAATVAPDPAGSNRTEQLLAEPEVQRAMSAVKQAITQALDRMAERRGPGAALLRDGTFELAEKLLACPGAFFVPELVSSPGGPPIVRAAAVVRIGREDGATLKAMLERQQAALLGDGVEQVEIGGETWYRMKLGPPLSAVTWGLRGSYLIVGVGAGMVEGVLQRARTAPPKWLADVRAALPVERPATCTYVNVQAIIREAGGADEAEVARVVEPLGLGNVQYAAAVTGLDGDGFLTRTLLAIDGEPEGLLELLAGEPLEAADFAPIPADATFAGAVRLDLQKAFDWLVGTARHSGDKHFMYRIEELERATEIDLRRDLLRPLGDRWRVYGSPSEVGIVPLGAVAVASVDDHASLAATHEKLLAFVKSQLTSEPEFRRRPGPQIEQFEHAGRTVYFFNARSSDMPLAPAWCLTEEELIVSLFPQGIKAYLSRPANTASLAQSPDIDAALSSTAAPTSLFYIDSKRVFELMYPAIPVLAQAALSGVTRQGIDLDVSMVPSAPAIGKHLRPSVTTFRRTPEGIEWASRKTSPGGSFAPVVPMAAFIALPAASGARQAARQAQSMNHLKQVGLAMHMYQDSHGKLPPAYVADEDAKPLLSWRVLILPYIEQKPLYDQFKLDEPWDSEHNKKLLESMPATYRSPAGTAAPGMTNYLAVRGEKTAFTGAEGVRFADIRDGLSRTVMVVEVDDARAVPWTKPDDFAHDEEQPRAGLGGLWPDGFLALFGDGAVRRIRKSINPATLNALFTRAGGEVVDLSEF